MNDMVIGTLLPELVTVSCEACEGEGYVLRAQRGGDLYDEVPECCDVCGGRGDLEVCGGCFEVPVLEDGVEICGCAALPLKQAA